MRREGWEAYRCNVAVSGTRGTKYRGNVYYRVGSNVQLLSRSLFYPYPTHLASSFFSPSHLFLLNPFLHFMLVQLCLFCSVSMDGVWSQFLQSSH